MTARQNSTVMPMTHLNEPPSIFQFVIGFAIILIAIKATAQVFLRCMHTGDTSTTLVPAAIIHNPTLQPSEGVPIVSARSSAIQHYNTFDSVLQVAASIIRGPIDWIEGVSMRMSNSDGTGTFRSISAGTGSEQGTVSQTSWNSQYITYAEVETPTESYSAFRSTNDRHIQYQ